MVRAGAVAHPLHRHLHRPLSRRPRPLRRPHRLLVGRSVRHATGGVLLLAADLHRRSAHPVLDARLLRLDQADRDKRDAIRGVDWREYRPRPPRQICRGLFSCSAWRSMPGANPRARDALRGGRGLVALAIALAFIAPNVLWNANHSFATFSHTAENAGWKDILNLGSGLEFIGSQFAVFGPILFAVLIVVAWRAWRRGCEQPECRLLAFSIPVILLLIVQALLSRALANWAAAAYPAATILVTAELLRHYPRLFRISLWLHLGAALVITVAPLFATRITTLTGPEVEPLCPRHRMARPSSIDPSPCRGARGKDGACRQPRNDGGADLLPARHLTPRHHLVPRRRPAQSFRDDAAPSPKPHQTQCFTLR